MPFANIPLASMKSVTHYSASDSFQTVTFANEHVGPFCQNVQDFGIRLIILSGTETLLAKEHICQLQFIKHI